MLRGSWKVCGHWAGNLSHSFAGPQSWEDTNHQFHLYYLLWSCCLSALACHLCLFCLAPGLGPHLAVSDCQGTGNRKQKDVKVKVLRVNKLAHPYKICVFRLNFNLWVNYPSSLQTVQSFSSRMTCLPHLSVPHGLLHTQPGRLHTCLWVILSMMASFTELHFKPLGLLWLQLGLLPFRDDDWLGRFRGSVSLFARGLWFSQVWKAGGFC